MDEMASRVANGLTLELKSMK